MSARAMLILCLFWTAPVQAQAGLRVLLLGSETSDPAWVRSLQIELGAEGCELVQSSRRSMARDPLDAQAQARRAGANAAVWIESAPDIESVRVHAWVAGAPRALAAALEEGRDGRTLALVVVSLLDDAMISARSAATPRARVTASLGSQLDRPLSVGPSFELPDQELPDQEPSSEPPTSSGPQLYAGVGLGALALTSDIDLDGGGFIRGVLGVRLRDLVRVQASLEIGLYNEKLGNGPETQPFARLCPEVALAPHIGGGTRITVGVHGCGGFAEARFFDVLRPPLGWGVTEGLVATLAGGGFLGVEVSIDESMNLWIRADLDGTTAVEVARQPDVLVSLSTTLELF